MNSLDDTSTLAQLQALQRRILSGTLGVQQIAGDVFHAPLGPQQLVLPRSFTVSGTRFVLDSWTMGQSVFDRVLWDTDGVLNPQDRVLRRIPSGLDVAFAVLGNDTTVPYLAERIRDGSGLPFRDGLPYQHNLAALRAVVDQQTSAAWSADIYSAWLGALRELSAPTTGPEYPQAMRTKAWAGKTLNTQLASWTHLRHDNVLYAKEAYTPSGLCSYPKGFVEPLPRFYDAMASVAQTTARALQAGTFVGSVTLTNECYDPSWEPPSARWIRTSLETMRSNQLAFCNRFVTALQTLSGIAAKELAQQPLTTNETGFIEDTIELRSEYGGFRLLTGWYPSLFYSGAFRPLGRCSAMDLHPSDQWDAVTAGVHTDSPDLLTGDPGGVLHEAVGNVNLLMIAIDNGPARCIYAGPVLSYYEFLTPFAQRLTDDEWKTRVKQAQLPAPPEWTRDYLAPGSITIPSWAE